MSRSWTWLVVSTVGVHGLDRTFAPFPGARPPHWLDDTTLLVSAEDRGNVHLFRVAADGAGPRAVLWGRGRLTGFDRAGEYRVHLSTATRPGELYVLGDGPRQALSTSRRRSPPRPTAGRTEHSPSRRPTAAVDLDAWILTPPDLDPTGLLSDARQRPWRAVHPVRQPLLRRGPDPGGCGLCGGWCNPRAARAGRSLRSGHMRRPLGGTGWGSVDFDDVMGLVDHSLKAFPYLDADRLGILGGSYGGYMTSWAVGHTDRSGRPQRAGVQQHAQPRLRSDAAGAFRTCVGRTTSRRPSSTRQCRPSPTSATSTRRS